MAATISYLKQNYPEVDMLVLKSATYGESLKTRNRKFVEDITPSNLEMIDDFSKFILVSKKGDIKYILNWKDYNDDWKNSKAMLERTIIPLLK
ncbi:hypothetical protein P0M11_11490 [Kaistella sp. PBT33-4]|uniref:hypothetical protein n=1 Tax=Kaistella sp. PBT33-4 TaxID=3032000 RepID=UPI0023D8ADD5|nr:hypothetical protein [Kaistella sp. PBT33-4]MDF0720621.1 hypothetical protein [Kaistella sp. PBT33-4]